MTDIRRIVTLTSSVVKVGPRIAQWAYSLQPYRDRGINVQVRAERGRTHVEAVDIETGALIAAAVEVVSLQRMDALRAPKSATVIRVASDRGIPHRSIPLAA